MISHTQSQRSLPNSLQSYLVLCGLNQFYLTLLRYNRITSNTGWCNVALIKSTQPCPSKHPQLTTTFILMPSCCLWMLDDLWNPRQYTVFKHMHSRSTLVVSSRFYICSDESLSIPANHIVLCVNMLVLISYLTRVLFSHQNPTRSTLFPLMLFTCRIALIECDQWLAMISWSQGGLDGMNYDSSCWCDACM